MRNRTNETRASEITSNRGKSADGIVSLIEKKTLGRVVDQSSCVRSSVLPAFTNPLTHWHHNLERMRG